MTRKAPASLSSRAIAWLIAAVLAIAVPMVALTVGSGTAPTLSIQGPLQEASASSIQTFSAESDTFLAAERPTQAHGDLPSLTVAAEPVQVALVRFRVTGLAGPVARATLALSPVSGSSVGFEVRAVADTVWGEDIVTYEHAPSGASTVTALSGPVVPGQWTSVDVTPLVVANGPVSLMLTTTGDDGLLLASRESGSTGPQLVVEPGSATAGQPLLRVGDPVVAAAGDIACNLNSGFFATCTMQETSDLLVDSGLTAVLTLGDNQDDGAEIGDYRGSYDLTWGRVKTITHPVPGDDDFRIGAGAAYYDYFGAAAGARGKGYYSYDVGAWHVVALNSNCVEVGGCRAGFAQERWLRADLAAHRNRCVLAYWHHPRFSSGLQGANPGMDGLWRALYAWGADVVLNAHAHDYERFAPQTPDGALDPRRGIREFVVGTGGTLPQAVNPPSPNSEVLHTGDSGVLELTLHPNGYDWRFVAAGNGRFSDSGSGTCH